MLVCVDGCVIRFEQKTPGHSAKQKLFVSYCRCVLIWVLQAIEVVVPSKILLSSLGDYHTDVFFCVSESQTSLRRSGSCFFFIIYNYWRAREKGGGVPPK